MPADSLHTQLRAAFPGQGSLALETKTGFTKSKARGKAMEGGPCPKPPASVGDMARTRAQDVHATPVLRVGGFSMPPDHEGPLLSLNGIGEVLPF